MGATRPWEGGAGPSGLRGGRDLNRRARGARSYIYSIRKTRNVKPNQSTTESVRDFRPIDPASYPRCKCELASAPWAAQAARRLAAGAAGAVPGWKVKSAAVRLATVTFLMVMVSALSRVMMTLAPDWTMWLCTAAKLAKVAVEKSMVSWAGAGGDEAGDDVLAEALVEDEAVGADAAVEAVDLPASLTRTRLPSRLAIRGTDLVQAHPRRLDAEDPGDGRAQERGDHQDMQQGPGPDIGEEDRERGRRSSPRRSWRRRRRSPRPCRGWRSGRPRRPADRSAHWGRDWS